MSFQPGFMGAPTTTPTDNLDDQQRRMTNMITSGMESCLAKSIMSGTAGFALGGVFGLFMSSMAYDTPMSPQGAALTSLPMKEQLRRGFKDMGSRSWSSAKNFGRIGAIFSICECTVEGFRAKNDLWNSAAGGGLAGVWLAKSAGPQAMVLGGGGFAAFSTAIDWYMRQPESD